MSRRAAARFYDGETALPHAVEAALNGASLRIRPPISTGGRALPAALDWPLATLALQDETAGGGFCLSSPRSPGARLILTDAAFRERLAEAAPQLSPRHRARRLRRLLAVSTLAAIAVAALVWQGGATALREAAALVPPEIEQRIGENGFRQIRQMFATGDRPLRICDGPAGQRALDTLAARLMANADTPHTARVAVLDHREVNALALPGGRIVLFRGLVEAAETSDEVAAVLAHEIAHVVHRHGMQGLLRSLGTGLVLDLMMGGVGTLGQAGLLVLENAHTREMEAEADATGIELLAAAAIDTGGLARFFERLAEAEAVLPSAFAYFSTHPPSAHRAEAARTAAVAGGPAMDANAWRALQSICG